MMRTNLFFIALLAAATVQAQTSEIVSIGPGYTQQVWYDLETGNESSRSCDEWDLAFEIQGFAASILANTQKAGLMLFEAPYEVSEWSTLDTAGIGSWKQLQNSPMSWSSGAFNQGMTADSLDLGWGNYNFITHIVAGDSLYVIALANGNYKKLRIDALAAGQYLFTYADVDGSNEVSATVDKLDYTDKNFAYYSIENDMEIDREPLNTDWDLTFVRYIEFVPTPYAVTGVLVNKWAESGEIASVPVGSTDWTSANFNGDMNTIGFDWKSFNMNTFMWEIQDSLTYFVHTTEGNIWEVVFTDFGGAATGEFFFDKQMISATSVTENDRSDIRLFPNPAVSELSISGLNGELLVLRDVQGRELLSNNASSSPIVLDVSGFPEGLYFLEIQDGAERSTEKVIISR